MPGKLLPRRLHTLPQVTHNKDDYYVDYPLVANDTVTNEVFYVEYNFTICSSNAGATTLYKWNGGGWTALSGISNPEYVYGHGFFSVTTSADCYVTITEDVKGGPES